MAILKQVKVKGRNSSQSGTPVSGDQTSVWLCEGTLSRFEVKLAVADHVVCAIQSVDGKGQTDGNWGKNVSKMGKKHCLDAKTIGIEARNGGCPEFCVNGASINSLAFSPQTG
jgi:hypothetical protein